MTLDVHQALLGKMKTASEACPSDLVLDRLRLGEMAAPEEGPVRDHLSGCALCRARESELASPSRFDDAERALMLASIRAQSSSARVAKKPNVRPLFAAVASLFAIAAASVLFLRVNVVDGEANATRQKGTSLVLIVYRERGGEVVEAKSGSVFQAGDRVRFGVAVPRSGYGMVVGIDASGKIFPAAPSGSDRSIALEVTSRARILPDTIELDRASGRERLYLIYCSREFLRSELKVEGAMLSTPEECSSTAFDLEKAR